MNTNRLLWVLPLLMGFISLSGCESNFKKNEDYVHYETLPARKQDDRIYPLSLLQLDKKIDVILSIDNSGSMSDIQSSVIANAELFFNEFAKASYVDWKLGLISTSHEEEPYLGFNKSFDSSLISSSDPGSFKKVVEEFQSAVRRLGISGNATDESTFLPVRLRLDEFNGSSASRPAFLRSNAHLVIISITDEKEQSAEVPAYDNPPPGYNPKQYLAAPFYNLLSTYINSNKILRFYGAIANKEFPGCTHDGGWNLKWDDSEYAKIIKLSNGFYVPACSDRFGADLAKIAEDITSLIGRPSLLLRKRPKVATIKLYYKGKLLPPGDESEGGYWYYDEASNTINFYGLDFVDDIQKDTFTIDFEVDDGIIRQY